MKQTKDLIKLFIFMIVKDKFQFEFIDFSSLEFYLKALKAVLKTTFNLDSAYRFQTKNIIDSF